MSNRLTSIGSLNYQGTNATNPPNIIVRSNAPTQNDTQNVSLGDFWIHRKSNTANDSDLYVLMGLAGGIADWDLISGNQGTVISLTGDDSIQVFPTNGNINVLATPTAGSTVSFSGSGSTLSLNVTAPGSINNNTFIGLNAGNLSDGGEGGSTSVGESSLTALTGVGALNTAIGRFALQNATTARSCTAIGHGSLRSLTTGDGSTAVGYGALAISNGSSNDAFGDGALLNLTGTASNNVSIGSGSLQNIVSGEFNNALGADAGYNYTTSESSNIIIGNGGTVGDNNILRIGTYGNGSAQQNKCYIAAAYSNYGTQNTFVGELSGNTTLTTASATTNVGVGYNTLNSITTAAGQVAIGAGALSDVTTAGGSTNIAVGPGALSSISTTGANVAIGYLSLSTSTANQNTSVGHASAENLISGTDSCFFGFQTGSSYTGAESNNILIGSSVSGTLGESNVIRIGNAATKTFISGIRGITTTVNDAVAVLIDSAGQLGTVSSSARYKENIEDMSSSSNDLMKLRPVTFQYKNDESKSKRYGLIAEEVAELFPDLAVFNNDGSVETVKYHEMAPILLNELQKLSKRVKELEDTIKSYKEKL